MSRHFETEMRDDIEQSIQIPVNSRKSYNVLNRSSVSKQTRFMGRIYSFFELFQAKKFPVFWGPKIKKARRILVNTQIYVFNHLNLI